MSPHLAFFDQRNKGKERTSNYIYKERKNANMDRSKRIAMLRAAKEAKGKRLRGELPAKDEEGAEGAATSSSPPLKRAKVGSDEVSRSQTPSSHINIDSHNNNYDNNSSSNNMDQEEGRNEGRVRQGGEEEMKITPAGFLEKVQEVATAEVTLAAAREEPKSDGVDILSINPQKVNWDLKQSVAGKLKKLEKRTQRAIFELIKKRMKGLSEEKPKGK